MNILLSFEEASGKAQQNKLSGNAMEETLEHDDFNIKGTKVKSQLNKFNKCKQCDYASAYPGALSRHLKTHSGEKSHKCNQCNYAFSQAGNLRRHLKMHSGEKSNKCNQCDYASSRANVLRRHLKTHTGEKSNS